MLDLRLLPATRARRLVQARARTKVGQSWTIDSQLKIQQWFTLLDKQRDLVQVVLNFTLERGLA